MLTIDGSFGEGGGQVLRSALALSLCTGREFRMEKIRAGRPKPGLMRQHLAAVNAAAKIGQAQVDGAALSSTALTFKPGRVKPGDYHFAIGTAGSTTLLLQTILPALLVGAEAAPSTVTVEGGTHNPMAPPFDFLQKAFLPLVNRMGVTVTARLERAGFYPAGGGRIALNITPAVKLLPLDLPERGAIVRRCARAMVANLPRHIAQRELDLVARKLNWPAENLQVEEVNDSPGPGNIVVIEVESEHVTEVFTGFGNPAVRAEAVAEEAIQPCRRYLAAGVPVAEYLADQLLLPMALSGAGRFRTVALSRHATTHLELIAMFLDTTVSVEEQSRDSVIVRFGG